MLRADRARVWLTAVLAWQAAALIGAVCDQPPAPVEAPAQAVRSGRLLAEIPFERWAGKIFVPVIVNGKGPYSFAFDTGCPYVAIDARVAAEVGLQPFGAFTSRGAGEGGAESAHLSGVSVTLGGLQVGGPMGLHLKLNEIVGPTTGRRMDGLIGNDLAQRYTVEIDYGRAILRLWERDSFEYQGPGREVPVQVAGLTHLEGTVWPGVAREPGGPPESVSGTFVLDTGSRCGVSFTSSFVRRQKLLVNGAAPIETIVGHGVGGDVRHRVGRLSALELGGLRVEGPVADFAEEAGGIFGDRRLSGVIGARVLSRCTLILDYARGRVIFEPGPGIGERDRFDASGVWLEAHGDDFRRFVVRDVVEGSAAERAGIRVDDELTVVDGKAAAEWTLESLTERLKAAGERVKMRVKRGEETLELVVELREQV